MPSERVQRQINRFLDEAEAAIAKSDWPTVRTKANAVLRLDPQNADALTFLAAAEREPNGAGRWERRRAAEGESNVGTHRDAPSLRASPARDGQSDVAAEAGRAVRAPPSPLPCLPRLPPPQPPFPASGERAGERGPTAFANGRYTVKRFLGEGGKKKVYLAHDNVLDRNVAFALIKTEGLDDTAKTRITREAQPMGKLGDHPHLMPIHDLGREGDQPYMTLPLMRSGDVEGLIKKAPSHQLPIEKTLEIGIAVAKGLAFAHGKGIMHRDIKPGNVWMTAEGVAKIGDFGLAIASDTALRLTTAGMMVGTPCRTHRDVEPDRTLVTSSWMIVSCAESQSLKGTRTPVRAVVELWRMAYSPEEIVRELPHLAIAAVFDALSYYSDHQPEMNAYIEHNCVPEDQVGPRARER